MLIRPQMNSTGTESFKILSPQRLQTLLSSFTFSSLKFQPSINRPSLSTLHKHLQINKRNSFFCISTLMKNTPMHSTPCKTWKFILIPLFFLISPTCNVSNSCGFYLQNTSAIFYFCQSAL